MNKPIPKEVGERVWNLYSWHIKHQTTEDRAEADPQKAMDFAITYYSYFEEAAASGGIAQSILDCTEALQTQAEFVS